jgi:uncharacterized protein YyaL (SSP411 family)
MTTTHATTGRENRLAGESSPYLLLHRYNPVDWYPWGPEALERARREDKPIFLSVGYSTCYWCHVMERESFSSPAVAERMNRDFVNVKLDREERPDLDEVYMAATQILSGQGGWPNSVFLTPDLKPFYAGTYFPPEERYGRPGFSTLLADLAHAWESRRPDVEEQAEEMAKAMRRYLEERVAPIPEPPPAAVAGRAFESLAQRFDAQEGGFGGAPKFPSPSNLFLLQELAPTRPQAGEMLTATLDAMARGGIYDQVGGGFHRYATDRAWRIPHFEKMLYDNGFLLELYAGEHARTGDPQAARVVRETAAWLAREMTSPEGAFWSAIDAETHGHEGAFYVWTRDELLLALGEEDFTFLAPLLGFEGLPFFEGTHFVLHQPQRLEAAAERRRMAPAELIAEVAAGAERLFAARAARERPLTDDKVLADWNGIAIAGLATAGRLLGKPDYVARAARAADFLLANLRAQDGTLLHAWRAGQAKVPALLGDYAFLVRGLLALHEATEEGRWLTAASDLTRQQIARLRDPAGGFFVAGERDDLLFRSKEIFDGAAPSGNSVAALNLLDLAARTGEAGWRDEAAATLRAFGAVAATHPDAVRMLTIAVWRYHGGEEEEGEGRQAGGSGASPGLAAVAESSVTAQLFLGEEEEDGWQPFTVRLAIAPGWHLNAHPASEEGLIATAVAAREGKLRGVVYADPSPLTAGGEGPPLAVYEGEIEIRGEIRGGREIVLTFQPCDAARCLPAVERILSP